MVGKIIDITVPLRPELACWPGDSPISIEPVARISEGAGANISKYCFSSHAGTHVDPPYHFLESGHKLDQMPLDRLIGVCYVAEILESDIITAEELSKAGIPDDTQRLLIKTRNSRTWAEHPDSFHEDYVYISQDAAEWLVNRDIKLVGIDYLSVAQFKKGAPVHERLLSAGVVVLEGINLLDVEPGIYTLVCLPLLVRDGDGAPARTVLIRD